MNTTNKRKDTQKDDNNAKRAKKECVHGEKCYRKNPKHFMEYSHQHLEAILDNYKGTGSFIIPEKYNMDKFNIVEQLEMLVEKQIYVSPAKNKAKDVNEPCKSTNVREPCKSTDVNESCKSPIVNNTDMNACKTMDGGSSSMSNTNQLTKATEKPEVKKAHNLPSTKINSPKYGKDQQNIAKVKDSPGSSTKPLQCYTLLLKERKGNSSKSQETHHGSLKPQSLINNLESPNKQTSYNAEERKKDPNYRPIVPPTRRAEDYLSLVVPKGKMAAKHAANAPYYIFYTTITAAKETHHQPYSITFQEILDRSLGELKSSLQINFMIEIGWLLAQYYFAGYSEKKLTILYGEECSDLKNITQKKPQVDAHLVQMGSPFGKHHTKMMILCYEDGSLRVVVSTANLYLDDWENRTQGLWISPRCPELPPTAMPHDGDSPTLFKRYLLRYLSHYHNPAVSPYVERVKRCDFSHINVFLVASTPGSHFDTEWGMTRVGALLRQHCAIPASESSHWPLLAQASSIGSYGNQASLWLTGDFLHQFSKTKDQPQTLCSRPEVKLIYPSLENVKQSHDGLLGGGCLPYAASAHMKQTWLNDYLYQWRARSTRRGRAMPHVKSYARVSADCRRAACYVLTSANVSKAAWGSINKGNAALRIMSYEAGVMFLPKFVINEDFFPLSENARNRLILPYDVPLTKYTKEMSPWVSDYLSS